MKSNKRNQRTKSAKGVLLSLFLLFFCTASNAALLDWPWYTKKQHKVYCYSSQPTYRSQSKSYFVAPSQRTYIYAPRNQENSYAIPPEVNIYENVRPQAVMSAH